MKQAYLIIAHNKIEQLKFLLLLLDYEKHDIFILFDKKAKITEKQKNDLITNVAHDLRTPLTTIVGYLELIKNNQQLTKEEI